MTLSLIFVRVPVTSPLHLTGTADVFEAQFCLDVRVDNHVTQHHEIHVTAGTGTRGTWEVTLDLPRGKCILQLYEVSMKDGSHVNVVEVPVLVTSASLTDEQIDMLADGVTDFA